MRHNAVAAMSSAGLKRTYVSHNKTLNKMKTLNKLLKPALLIGAVMCCFSCQSRWEKLGYNDYTEYTVAEFNKLKKPVILIAKTKDLGNYSIVVKDANDTIIYFGNVSTMASAFGYSYNVGDTLK